jgi:hypothetical protein
MSWPLFEAQTSSRPYIPVEGETNEGINFTVYWQRASALGKPERRDAQYGALGTDRGFLVFRKVLPKMATSEQTGKEE